MEKNYSKKTNAELVEILELRCLSLAGKKKDYIARLEEYDRKIQHFEDTRPSNMPELELISGRFLVYDGKAPRMHATFSRIRSALEKHKCPFGIVDVSCVALFYMFWEKESKGRRLPALVKQGRIVGDLGQLRYWISTGDPKTCIDEACVREGVGVEDDPSLPYCRFDFFGIEGTESNVPQLDS